MSHSVKVNLIADQIIRLCGDEVNVHDIDAVVLDDWGIITSYIRSTNRVEAKAEAGYVCINCGKALEGIAYCGTCNELSSITVRDSERIDWLESAMRPKGVYVEIYLAGLRNGDSDAISYQVESNPTRIETQQGPTLRMAIDAAVKNSKWRCGKCGQTWSEEPAGDISESVTHHMGCGGEIKEYARPAPGSQSMHSQGKQGEAPRGPAEGGAGDRGQDVTSKLKTVVDGKIYFLQGESYGRRTSRPRAAGTGEGER